VKCLRRIKKMGHKVKLEYDFTPLTYILPTQYIKFMEIFTRFMEIEGDKNIWIMKPSAKSRGRGIHLINNIT